MKTPEQYMAAAVGSSTELPPDVAKVVLRTVEAVFHDFVMRLCQADYEGTAPTVLVSELLQLLNTTDDPRQQKLDFSS